MKRVLQNQFKTQTQPWTQLGSGVLGKEISVLVQIEEGNKTRLQTFSGFISDYHKAGFQTNITVMKESKGVWVSRVFPIYSPDIKGLRMKD